MDGEEHRLVVLLVVHVEVPGTQVTLHTRVLTTATGLRGRSATVVLGRCYLLSGMESAHGGAQACLIAAALIGLGGTCALHFVSGIALS